MHTPLCVSLTTSTASLISAGSTQSVITIGVSHRLVLAPDVTDEKKEPQSALGGEGRFGKTYNRSGVVHRCHLIKTRRSVAVLR